MQSGKRNSLVSRPYANSLSYLDSPVIRVVVGEDPITKEFGVHEGLICARSHFFKNAMTEPWKEVEDCKITLACEEPEIFTLYLELLYVSFGMHQTPTEVLIFRPQTNVLPVKETTVDGIANEYVTLSKLYVLAEMLIDDDTKNLVLAAILSRSREPSLDHKAYYPSVSCIYIIYGGTPEDSPARRLIVDLYTDFGDDTIGLAGNTGLPKDFFVDLSLSLLSKRPFPTVHKNLRAGYESSRSGYEDAESFHTYGSAYASDEPVWNFAGLGNANLDSDYGT